MTNSDEETGFADAYRSEILNKGKEKKESPLPKIISILLLVVVVSVISIFGYNYFTKSKSDTVVIEHKQEKSKEVKDIKKDTLPVSEFVEVAHAGDLKDMESSKIKSTPIPTPEPILTPEPTLEPTLTPIPTSTQNDIDQIANQMKIELSKELDKKSEISPKKIDSAPLKPKTQKGEALYMKQLKELSKEINREAI